MTAPQPPSPPPPTPPTAPPRHRRLRRDPHHRVLGGVAAGISKTYGIDLALVRVLWIVAGIAWIGVPAYIVAWIAIPKERDGENDDRDIPRDIGVWIALALIGVGLLVAIHQVFPGAWHAGRIGGPLLLIGAGVAILIIRRPVDDVPDAIAQDVEEPVVEPAEPPVEPATAWTQTEAWPAPPEPRKRERRQRPRPFLTPIAIAMLFIGAGVTGLLQASGAVDVNLTIALGVGTAFVGGVLILSTWIGRAYGLVAIGVLLAFATAASSVIDVPLRGGFGDKTYRPTTIAELQPKYEHAAGHLLLDLRQLPPSGFSDKSMTVNATLTFGYLEVVVPQGPRVQINAHSGVGEIDVFGSKDQGTDNNVHFSYPEGTGVPTNGTLVLNLRVGAGRIFVNS